jgi:hypothetical protein
MKLNVASLEDIGCMKIDTISARGKKRDFVDLYFILNSKKLRFKELFQTAGQGFWNSNLIPGFYSGDIMLNFCCGTTFGRARGQPAS